MRTSRIIYYAILSFLILVSVDAHGQIDAQFSQYYEVPAYYNPAASGATEYLRVRGGTRMQWVGIKNAPRTIAMTADMPLRLFKKNFGVGLVLHQENIGLYRTMNMGVQASFRFKLLGGELAPGIQIGFIDQTFKGSEVYIPDDDDYHEDNDDAIPRNDLKGHTFDMGFGLWYTHKWFWLSASMQHFSSPSITLSDEQSSGSTAQQDFEFTAGRALYFMAGSNIPVKNTLFEVMPSVFVKSDFTFTVAEFTARVRYNKFLTVGVGYRYKDAIIAMLAADYRNFYLGYSYDYSTSDIARVSSGSHEIFIGYRVKINKGEKNRHRHKNIRIM
ncbi:MAG: PorP/SprF family type IX secretion system membrane protein [Muribaculaceae bacterium]|nr:PorP/SprF family type IX secretion system membrane protein [Muribaculaceae bacterium]